MEIEQAQQESIDFEFKHVEVKEEIDLDDGNQNENLLCHEVKEELDEKEVTNEVEDGKNINSDFMKRENDSNQNEEFNSDSLTFCSPLLNIVNQRQDLSVKIKEEIPSGNGNKYEIIMCSEESDKVDKKNVSYEGEEGKHIEFEFIKTEIDWNESDQSEELNSESSTFCHIEYESHFSEESQITTAGVNPGFCQGMDITTQAVNTTLQKCSECHSTATQNDFKKHLSIYGEKQTYKCLQCTRQKPFKCANCDYSADSKTKIKSHIMRVHNGEKPYSCPHCDYCAAAHNDVKMHAMRIHSREKPHKCTHCDYSAVEKSSLKIHFMRVHVKEKPYKCAQCDYCAASRNDIKLHTMRIHSREKPYKCDHCDYSDVENAKLKIHFMRVHAREKPYKCTQCNYCGAAPNDIKLHTMRIHVREKPHKCLQCNYFSVTLTELKRHNKRMHTKGKAL